MTKKGIKTVFVYTPSDEVLEGLIKTYTDYVTNPYSELRQSDLYFERKYCYMGVGRNVPISPEYRALRYKHSPYGEQVLVENLPKPQHDATYAQFVVLLDTLFRKCYLGYDENDEEGYKPSVSATILKNTSEHYAYLLNVLRFEGITSGSTYTHVTISKPDIFSRKECKNRRVVDKISALRRKAREVWEGRMSTAKRVSTDIFIERYNQSLLSYTLDINRATERILSDPFMGAEEKTLKLHRTYNLNDVIGTELACLDDTADINGRWYHVGTKTLSIVRPYTNIRYIVDANSSQLTLFNYFLLAFYLGVDLNIFSTFSKFNTNTLRYHLSSYLSGPERRALEPSELMTVFTSDKRKENIQQGFGVNAEDVLSNVKEVNAFRDHTIAFSLIMEIIAKSDIYSSSTNHIHYTRSQYVSEKICKVLKDNGFKGEFLEKIQRIPTNVRRYFFQTCNGIFWQNLMDKTGMAKGPLKSAVFRNIFYSYPNSPVNDKNLRDTFRKEFPDVHKVLTFYKKKFKTECDINGLDRFIGLRDKEEKKVIRTWRDKYDLRVKGLLTLSHKITQLESSIFHDILNELFKDKRLRVIGIHDAIAVLNDEITADEVVKVAKKHFARYGVYASFKVEYLTAQPIS